MPLIDDNASDLPIAMSLRLWSDDVDLHPFVEALGARPAALQKRGWPIRVKGRLTERIARRHFASLAIRNGKNDADIESWMKPLATAICRNDALRAHVASDEIEAIFWIALLGERTLHEPKLDTRLIEQVTELNAKIFIENYTDLVAGNPRKSWLPATMSHTA